MIHHPFNSCGCRRPRTFGMFPGDHNPCTARRHHPIDDFSHAGSARCRRASLSLRPALRLSEEMRCNAITTVASTRDAGILACREPCHAGADLPWPGTCPVGHRSQTFVTLRETEPSLGRVSDHRLATHSRALWRRAGRRVICIVLRRPMILPAPHDPSGCRMILRGGPGFVVAAPGWADSFNNAARPSAAAAGGCSFGSARQFRPVALKDRHCAHPMRPGSKAADGRLRPPVSPRGRSSIASAVSRATEDAPACPTEAGSSFQSGVG